jgi:threonine dehydrogenase-like Zn-dependent dehydrogenase
MHERSEILKQSVALVAAVLFALIPLARSLRRARWANGLFVTVGIVGSAVIGTKLMVLLHWIGASRVVAQRIEAVNTFLCGFMGGMILALIVSSQLFGSESAGGGNGGADGH